jgi:putative oxidoreductase
MKKMNFKRCLQPLALPTSASTAVLILRLIVGTAFIIHGWGKMQSPFSWMPPQAPVPGFLQFLASISEFGGGLSLVFGLLVPVAMIGLSCTMAVAASMHMFVLKDPFVNLTGGSSFEPALGYLGCAILFMILGAGKFSLDRKIFGERK